MSYKTISVARTREETLIICDSPECEMSFILSAYRTWEDKDGYGTQVSHMEQCSCKFCPYCGQEIKPIDLDKEKDNDTIREGIDDSD